MDGGSTENGELFRELDLSSEGMKGSEGAPLIMEGSDGGVSGAFPGGGYDLRRPGHGGR